MFPTELQKLVNTFADNIDCYTNAAYNETQVRREFLDKFIKILGWDVDNDAGYAETFKEVIHEDRQKVDGKTKAPDYCIQSGGKKLFFIEAKKPSVNLKDDTSPAFQIRRYGWSAKLPLCILTDFQEFAVYDTTIKPNANDKASISRIFYCTYANLDKPYRDGLTHWEYLESLFSKNSVMRGSLEKFKKTDKKRGTQEVDDEFLKDIEVWREELAKNIIHNNTLTERELNTVVQNTIDRIIFLRICEDRDIEPENTLLKISNGKDIYSSLLTLFQQADAKYNSGLFHFRDERGNSEPADTLSLNVKIGDSVLRDIIKSLYYPAPYQFNQMPADILGSVYERFLGKVIHLTSNHRAIIEEKPEVRKAGGVYYTPSYIVDYIVENTIGEQLKGKTPKTIGKFRVVDPACGSGSFLIVAYQHFLDWYLDQYMKSPESYKKQLIKVDDKSYKLTINERKKILTDHIFGVDIDNQAVEVTKLSLLLKTLEGITAQEATPKLAIDRILPNLSNNIKCGNSLIGSDFYNGQQILDFSEEEQLKINVFDWDKEFREVFADGGFDAVIGNPPYVSIRTKDFDNFSKRYFSEKYKLAIGQYDLYALFTEKAYNILNKNGSYGFIIPKRMSSNENFTDLRKFYLQDFYISSYVDAGKCFDSASVEANIIICSKSYTGKKIIVYKIDNDNKYNITNTFTYKMIESLPFFAFSFDSNPEIIELLSKIIKYSETKFGDISDIIRGFECGFNNSQINKVEGKYKVIKGEHISRYKVLPTDYWVNPNFDTEPKIFKRPEIFLNIPKLLTKFVSNRLEFAIDDFGYCNTNVVYNIHLKNNDDLEWLLGVLNSKLINFWFNKTYVNNDKIFPHIQKNQLQSIPLPKLDGVQKQKIVSLVDSMLKLKQQEHNARTAQEQTMFQRQIAATDDAIDQLVYKLYNLTDEEIKIVERK